MVNVGTPKTHLTTILPALALATPAVLAARTGISPLDTGIELIGSIFNIQALQNEFVAVGVAKFGWFILIFALLNWLARTFVFNDAKGGEAAINKRTANIVSFVLAMISTFFVPDSLIMNATIGYSAIIWSILIMAPAFGVLVFAFGKAKTERDNGRRIVELILLILVFVWTLFLSANLAEWIGGVFPETTDIVDSVVSYMVVILLIAIIGKALGMASGGEGIGKLFGDGGTAPSTTTSSGAAKAAKGPRPGPVQNPRHEWDEPNGRLKITWEARPSDESVSGYEVRRRAAKWQGFNPNIAGGWKTFARTGGTVAYDTGATIQSGLSALRAWATYRQNRGVVPGIRYQYQVRAVNNNGPGPWTYTQPAGTPEEPTQRPDAPETVEHRATDNGVLVEWTARPPEEGVTEYKVQRKHNNPNATAYRQGETGNWKTVGTVRTTSFKDTEVPATDAQKYTYQVRAFNSQGKSAYKTSTFVSEEAAASNEPPRNPENVKLRLRQGVPSVSWDARPAREGVNHYVVDVSARNQNGSLTSLISEEVTETQKELNPIEDLNVLDHLVVRVKAVNELGESEWVEAELVHGRPRAIEIETHKDQDAVLNNETNVRGFFAVQVLVQFLNENGRSTDRIDQRVPVVQSTRGTRLGSHSGDQVETVPFPEGASFIRVSYPNNDFLEITVYAEKVDGTVINMESLEMHEDGDGYVIKIDQFTNYVRLNHRIKPHLEATDQRTITRAIADLKSAENVIAHQTRNDPGAAVMWSTKAMRDRRKRLQQAMNKLHRGHKRAAIDQAMNYLQRTNTVHFVILNSFINTPDSYPQIQEKVRSVARGEVPTWKDINEAIENFTHKLEEALGGEE